MYSKIAFAALVIVLIAVNYSIFKKERHLSEGRVVYLELAPVDPRSLMQGDFMALRFRVAEQVRQALPKLEKRRRWQHDIDAQDGYAVVVLDQRGVASFKRLALSDSELLLRYRVRNNAVKFATNAFFFQEGTAQVYTSARFGQFRVDNSGELLLAGMYDKYLVRLVPPEQAD